MKIYETVVYCGSQKVWRILNLITGTVYGMEYDDIDKAYAGIQDGEVRGDQVVKRVDFRDIKHVLAYCEDTHLMKHPKL